MDRGCKSGCCHHCSCRARDRRRSTCGQSDGCDSGSHRCCTRRGQCASNPGDHRSYTGIGHHFRTCCRHGSRSDRCQLCCDTRTCPRIGNGTCRS